MTAAMRDWQGAMRETSAQTNFAIDSVVIPLDGSDTAKLALPVARGFAQLRHSTLHVVYAGEQTGVPHETLQELGLSSQELRGAVLDCAADHLAETILRMSTDLPNAMVVMCTLRVAAGEDALGPLAEAVLNAAPARIVLLTPDAVREAWRPRRILLAHDGSPSADAAILPAATIAQLAGAEVIALHVAARQAKQPDEPGSLPAPRYIDQPQHEWPSWTNEFVTRMLALGGSAAAINFKLLVTGGQPGSEIAQFARDNDADLVVLPWHGNWQTQRGGAVDAVVRRCGCPVLLICTVSTT